MRTANQLQLVQVIELVDNFRAKKPARASRADLPRVDVLGVRPHEVTEGALGGRGGGLAGAAEDGD